MTTAQWNELLAAIESLRPTLWSTWLPVFAGLAGAAFGFFASVLKDAWTHWTDDRRTVAANVLALRREAIDDLNVDVSKWIHQWAGLEANWRDHHEHNATVSMRFVKTGFAADGDLQPFVLRFLNALDSSLNTYSSGWPNAEWENRWTDDIEQRYERFAIELRALSHDWLEGRLSLVGLSRFLGRSTQDLEVLGAASLAERVSSVGRAD